MKMKSKLFVVIQAILIAFAMQVRFGVVLNRQDYKSVVHYLYAGVTDLLGQFGFSGLLLSVLAAIFICWSRQNAYAEDNSGGILPFFFSFCLLLGQSYAQTNSWDGCFGDCFRLIRFIIAFAGYAILFSYLLPLFLGLYKRAAETTWKSSGRLERFLGEKSFRNVFVLLLLLWAPVLLLSYPANLCYDFIGQVSQTMGLSAYSTHHPLLHTLIAGGIIKLGGSIMGSADFGLFLYLIAQAAALAAALAATVSRLAKRQVSVVLRLAVVAIYVFAPMYSNMASTAIKDIPFMAALIWYMLLLEELVTEGIEGKPRRYLVCLVAAGTLTGLLRNNGIYVVGLTGIALVCRFAGKMSKRTVLTVCFCTVVLPLGFSVAGNKVMAGILSAEKGSIAEALSIPFQQTARYLTVYEGELTQEERRAIERVLGDVRQIAGRYDPDSSDAVKALYHRDAEVSDLLAYFRAWLTGFFKHPASYVQAFFTHVYGWFDPGVTNSIRYEVETELFRQGGLIPGIDKVLLFIYRFAAYIPFLETLENVGIYTWLLFILAGVMIRRKDGRGILLFPLFVSLLVCMASPCFYLHPRYAYPIMFTIPFLYGVLSRRMMNETGRE